MKNFQNISRIILNFLGYTLYSLIFALPSYSSLESGEWECQEGESYNIKGNFKLSIDESKRETQFNENFKNLKVFKVTYDLKNRIATINGSPAILTGGENNHDVYNNIEAKTEENGTTTTKTIIKNDLYPVIIFSEYSKEISEREKKSGHSKDSQLIKKLRVIRNYLIIDDLFKDSSTFTRIIYYSQRNSKRITNKKFEDGGYKKNNNYLIELSKGLCKKTEK